MFFNVLQRKKKCQLGDLKKYILRMKGGGGAPPKHLPRGAT